MAKKDYVKEIKDAKSIEELVKIGHSIEEKGKDIDNAIREKMNELLSEFLR